MKTNKSLLNLLMISLVATCLFGCAKEEIKTGNICYVNVDCKDILGNMEDFVPEKTDILPKDGIILTDAEIEIYDGDTALSVTERALKEEKIHIDVLASSLGTSYIKGIGNIYEGDCGAMSGWSYKVNGESPDVGADNYIISAGDKIEWVYICSWDME